MDGGGAHGDGMGDTMNPIELAEELQRLSTLVDQSLAYLKDKTIEYAQAEDEYRMSKAKALLNADASTVADREAHAVLATSAERQRAHLAEGMQRAALEAVRSRRAQLSAIQTLVNLFKAEIDMTTYGPDRG